MPNKIFTLDGGPDVTVYKRRGNRNLRLSISPHGQVRVSIPAWAPYRAGLEFARSRQDWILSQHQPVAPLKHGQAIGKGHHLQFMAKPAAAKATSRISDTTIVVSHPATEPPDGADSQRVARTACVRALRRQAEQLLPQRLAALAATHDFTYQEVRVKQLKSRWGSCDHQARIVLNLFLMQLSWELIDYVLLHELTHTKILRHGPDFWRNMETVLPKTSTLRQELRGFHPILAPG
jgi:predicted metal-dependent hydrolase